MLKLEQVSKHYGSGAEMVIALENINMEVKDGEFVVIQGPSGSGKTTLLLTLGGMMQPTSGTVISDKSNIYALNERKRAKFRAENIGFVFQMFHLIPYLNSIENILLSVNAGFKPEAQAEAMKLMKRFQISERAHHKPSALSVGEHQRTAIARALLKKPKIILADEPTGNLDPENASEVIGYLVEFHRQKGTVILVTHGKMADSFADRIIHLRNGRIE